MSSEITPLTLVRQKNVASLVTELNMTQKEVARKAGVSITTVANFFKNPPPQNYSESVIRKLEHGLGVEVGWLSNDHSRDEPVQIRTPDNDAMPKGTLSMNANGFIVRNRRITDEQADAILRILIE